MRTEELIVQLAGSAAAVEPLASPARRLWWWIAGAAAATAAGAAIIGVRPDAAAMSRHFDFLAVAALTAATSVVAAGSALVLGVPGAGRSSIFRWAPVAAAAAWAALLVSSVLSGGSAIDRLLSFPFHIGCVIQIVGLSVIPGWTLFAMLRRAAPLRVFWAAGLSGLAALAAAAAAVQFICPIADPAHQLVGHLMPVAALALAEASTGARVFRTRRVERR